MIRKNIAAVVGAVLLFGSSALADTPLPTAKPEEIGLSPKQLGRMTDVVRGEIDKGRIPGAVMLVARNGKLGYFEALGNRDPQAGQPMQKDAIFRIYSMTKPIVSVATMMLVEEGRIQLADPASKYLPALKD